MPDNIDISTCLEIPCFTEHRINIFIDTSNNQCTHAKIEEKFLDVFCICDTIYSIYSSSLFLDTIDV